MDSTSSPKLPMRSRRLVVGATDLPGRCGAWWHPNEACAIDDAWVILAIRAFGVVSGMARASTRPVPGASR